MRVPGRPLPRLLAAGVAGTLVAGSLFAFGQEIAPVGPRQAGVMSLSRQDSILAAPRT